MRSFTVFILFDRNKFIYFEDILTLAHFVVLVCNTLSFVITNIIICKDRCAFKLLIIWKIFDFIPAFFYAIYRSAQSIVIFKEADAVLSTRNASLECATARCASRHEISVNSRAGSWENSVWNAIPSLPCIITRSRRHFRVPALQRFVRYRTR